MKTNKFITTCIALVALCLPGCTDDDAADPEFGEKELYIYNKMAEFVTVNQGDEVQWTMMVSPNDGSVSFRWLLDGIVIWTEKDLVDYAFDVIGGPFELRFEAMRNGVVNYRTFQLTVSEPPL